MLKKNLKITFRNLLEDRQFTFLNLIGLATGFVCTFLILGHASTLTTEHDMKSLQMKI